MTKRGYQTGFAFLTGCFIRMVLVLIVFLVGIGLFIHFSGLSCIQRIDNTLPDTKEAPWEVTTIYRLYYAKDIEIVHDQAGEISTVTMLGWWERKAGKWEYHPETIALESRIHGEIRVQRRIA